MREIERKFLVDIEKWDMYKSTYPASTIASVVQGYLSVDNSTTTRVRIQKLLQFLGASVQSKDIAWLTVKGSPTNITRPEFEYFIPVEDAHELLNLCNNYMIEKIRYTIIHEDKKWFIDEFKGPHNGLCLAEIELITEDEQIVLPSWVTTEVSTDKKYTNAYLAQYNNWIMKDISSNECK